MTTTEDTLNAQKIMPGLTVNDLSKSISFYEGLGFSIEHRWEEDGKLLGIMFQAGDAKLGLSQDDGAKGMDRVKGVGIRLWLEIQKDVDVDALAARAKAAGVTLDGEPEDFPWGGRGFAVTDPDGFKLTISTAP